MYIIHHCETNHLRHYTYNDDNIYYIYISAREYGMFKILVYTTDFPTAFSCLIFFIKQETEKLKTRNSQMI